MSSGAYAEFGNKRKRPRLPLFIPLKSSLLPAAICLVFLLGACVAPPWVPFVGQKTGSEDIAGEVSEGGAQAGSQEPQIATQSAAQGAAQGAYGGAPPELMAGPAPQAAAVPMGAAAAEPERAVQTTKKPISLGTSPHESFPDKLPGEDEFLRGEFGAALPPLISAFYQGDIRGAFYARIIYENGLDGRAPNPGEAGRALSMLTLKYKEILRLAREAPRSKRALYQTALGLLYFRGLVPGSERDLKAAKAWAKVAADDDFGPAMNLMAAISCEPVPPKILFGLWTPSHKDCFTWTMDAAETGDILAIANLSYLYREGVGVDMDPLMAVNWAHNAVKRDPPSARAQNDMGAYYLLGVGVTRDPEEARRWFAMAQSRYPLAAQNLGRLGTSDPLVENRVAY